MIKSPPSRMRRNDTANGRNKVAVTPFVSDTYRSDPVLVQPHIVCARHPGAVKHLCAQLRKNFEFEEGPCLNAVAVAVRFGGSFRGEIPNPSGTAISKMRSCLDSVAMTYGRTPDTIPIFKLGQGRPSPFVMEVRNKHHDAGNWTSDEVAR